MATPLLGLYTPTTGTDAGTWGDGWNNEGSTYLDNIIAGRTTLNLTSSDVLLTAAQARTQMLYCSGALLADIDISPDTGVLWYGLRSITNVTSGNFALTLTNSAGSLTIPQGRRCMVYIDNTTGPQIMSTAGTVAADPVPAGTKWAFYQAAAPSGYTQDTSLNDYAIRLVNSTGAGTGGSVNFSTLFARTATDAHTLTESQIPAHYHTYGTSNPGNFGSGSAQSIYGTTGGSYQTSTTGGGGSHTHNIDMRVKYADFIIASRI